MDVGDVRLDPDRVPIGGDRLLQLPLFLQGDAAVEKSFGICRPLSPLVPEPETSQEVPGDGRDYGTERPLPRPAAGSGADGETG